MDELKEKIENIFQHVIDYNGFSHQLFKVMKMTSIKKGYIEFKFKTTDQPFFTKQPSGWIATILDGVGALAYLTTQSTDSLNFGVTVNLNINYIPEQGDNISIETGEELITKAIVEKLTRSLCFVEATLEKKDGTIISIAKAVYKVPQTLKSNL